MYCGEYSVLTIWLIEAVRNILVIIPSTIIAYYLYSSLSYMNKRWLAPENENKARFYNGALMVGAWIVWVIITTSAGNSSLAKSLTCFGS